MKPKRNSPLPRRAYDTVAVEHLRQLTEAVAAGQNIYNAAVSLFADHRIEYRTNAVMRACALLKLRGTYASLSRSEVSAAALCRCTAPWIQPGAPQFDAWEFWRMQLRMLVGGAA